MKKLIITMLTAVSVAACGEKAAISSPPSSASHSSHAYHCAGIDNQLLVDILPSRKKIVINNRPYKLTTTKSFPDSKARGFYTDTFTNPQGQRVYNAIIMVDSRVYFVQYPARYTMQDTDIDSRQLLCESEVIRG